MLNLYWFFWNVTSQISNTDGCLLWLLTLPFWLYKTCKDCNSHWFQEPQWETVDVLRSCCEEELCVAVLMRSRALIMSSYKSKHHFLWRCNQKLYKKAFSLLHNFLFFSFFTYFKRESSGAEREKDSKHNAVRRKKILVQLVWTKLDFFLVSCILWDSFLFVNQKNVFKSIFWVYLSNIKFTFHSLTLSLLLIFNLDLFCFTNITQICMYTVFDFSALVSADYESLQQVPCDYNWESLHLKIRLLYINPVD